MENYKFSDLSPTYDLALLEQLLTRSSLANQLTHATQLPKARFKLDIEARGSK
jgi:hypothetical protein